MWVWEEMQLVTRGFDAQATAGCFTLPALWRVW